MGNIFNLIAENNIDPEKVFQLVEKIKTTDLQNESNLRLIIQEVADLAGKKIDKFQEDQLVKKILRDGINEDLFSMF